MAVAVGRRPQTDGVNNREEEDDDNEHQLDDLDAALLQSLIAKRVLKLEDALKIFDAIAEVTQTDIPVSQDSFEEATSRVNIAIHDFDLEVRKALDQSTGNPIWAIVNTTSDPFTQLATLHSPSEIVYMRALLAAIFEASNSLHEEVYAIRMSEAVNLSSVRGVGLTKTAGEACVEQFIQEGWLVRSRAGFVTLTERGIMELKGYLTETFNEIEDEEAGTRTNYIKTCYGCQEIITKGQRCPTLRCPVRFHDHCSSHFFTPRNQNCPSCKSPWKDHLPVGEKACSDRARRQRSNRRQSRSESPASTRSSLPPSPSSRMSSVTVGRATPPGTSRRGSGRAASRRTSAAQSIQEEDEEDLYG